LQVLQSTVDTDATVLIFIVSMFIVFST